MDAKPYQPGQQLPGTVYRVVRHLATGGMGSVYDVEDVTVGKRYVLKTLLPQLLERKDLARRMEAEARTLARLAHPNIVEVVTAGVTSGDFKMPYYVMERLNGQNLRVVLDKKSALELPHCHRIAIDVLDALGHAHENGVIHRDVKPENIFLHRNASGITITKLLDFGIMRLLDQKSSQTQGKFIGTLRYASPEQIMGDELGPSTDVYSLAVVLYEMICGRGPFDDAGDAYAVGAAHAQRPPPPLSRFVRVPRPIEDLVMAALAKRPSDRPRDAFVMAGELRKFRHVEEPLQPPSTAAEILSVPVSQQPTRAPSPAPSPYSGTVGDTVAEVDSKVLVDSRAGKAPVLPETMLAIGQGPSPRHVPGGPPPMLSRTMPLVHEAPRHAVAPVRDARESVQAQGPTEFFLGPSDRGVDRNAMTHASAPLGTTRRLAVNGTLMDSELSADDAMVRRAFDEPLRLEVPSPNGSGSGELLFSPLGPAPSTEDGLAVGGARPRSESKFVLPLVAALVVGALTVGFFVYRSKSSAAMSPPSPSAASAAPSDPSSTGTPIQPSEAATFPENLAHETARGTSPSPDRVTPIASDAGNANSVVVGTSSSTRTKGATPTTRGHAVEGRESRPSTPSTPASSSPDSSRRSNVETKPSTPGPTAPEDVKFE